ncbi:MAG: GAF domain-containing protein, partial [Thermodesulfovibrionales bacterium]|nr:GAF domain-containing protein [Thermodesulfovibrionales bacterium]
DNKSYNEVLDFGLEEAITITKSKIGYIFFYNEETRLFTLYAWSKNVMQECSIKEKQTIYELDKTGLWGEAVRQRKPVITNDYNEPNPLIKGYPEGHVKIQRHMNLPIFRKNKIVAVIGVGNKETDYTNSDVEQLQLFMEGLWNILEKKEIEQALKKSEEMFKTIINFTHDWEYWESLDKKILYCSPSCQRITGYNPQAFSTNVNLINDIIHNDDRDIYTSHLQSIHESEEIESELQFRIIRKDGQERWIGHVCRPVFDNEGKFVGRRVSNRDITERKFRELESIKSQEQINILNKNILKMLKIMSHDIRSPLIAISATLKLLLRGTYGKLEESVYHTVNDLYLRLNHIIGFAEDCLAKAQAVDCELHFEKNEIDLRNEVIEPVLTELLPQIEEKGIFIDNKLGAIPTGSIKVNANKMWLKVVYRNLFSNAIKYGGNGCTIAFGYEDHGSYYRFNVYNTGNPIPEEKRGLLFTKFGRISQEGENHHEGVGMGLFMTKEIITEHGGSIWYEARPYGNDFIFTLPK